MNQPTTRRAYPLARVLHSLSCWRDGAGRCVRQCWPHVVEVLAAWRQRGRDREALRHLGACELRDIGLARRDEATIGERAIGRL